MLNKKPPDNKLVAFLACLLGAICYTVFMANKYPQIAQNTLDLHNYTQEEAKKAVGDFLDESEQAGYKIVRIIVGKGIHSEKGPILGNFVRNLLDEGNYDYNDAKVNEGGEGAIDIRL